MPFQQLLSTLPAQFIDDFTDPRTYFSIQTLLTVLGNKHYVVFAISSDVR
jgi:hypothetical protein